MTSAFAGSFSASLAAVVSSGLLTSGCGVVTGGVAAAIVLSSDGGDSGGEVKLPSVQTSLSRRQVEAPHRIRTAIGITAGGGGRITARVEYEIARGLSDDLPRLGRRLATPEEGGENPTETTKVTNLNGTEIFEATFLWDAGRDLGGESAEVKLFVVPCEDGVEGTALETGPFIAGDTPPWIHGETGEHHLGFASQRNTETGEVEIEVTFRIFDYESDDVCLVNVDLAADGGQRVSLPPGFFSGATLASKPPGTLGVPASFRFPVTALDAKQFPEEIRRIGRPGFHGELDVRLDIAQSLRSGETPCVYADCCLRHPCSVPCGIEGRYDFDNNAPPFVELLPVDVPVSPSGIVPIRYRLFDPDKENNDDHEGHRASHVQIEMVVGERRRQANEFPGRVSGGRTDLVTLAEDSFGDPDSPFHIFLWDALSQVVELEPSVVFSITAYDADGKPGPPSSQRLLGLSFAGLSPSTILDVGCPGPCLRAVASGDFDGDGFTDVVVASADPRDRGLSTVYRQFVFAGVNEGLSFKNTIELGTPAADIVSGYFDSDRFVDVVFAEAGGRVTYVRGSENGLGEDRESTSVNSLPLALWADDFDGDGHLDTVVSTEHSRTQAHYLVYVQGGDRGFSSDSESRQLPIEPAARTATSGDFNGDGPGDLVVALDSGEVVFLPGSPEGLQGPQQRLQLERGPAALLRGRFDRDEFPDVVVANKDSSRVRLLRGTANGFLADEPIVVKERPVALTTADYDGDGVSDVVVASDLSNLVTYLRGGDDGLEAAGEVEVGHGPVGLLSGDYDGDGFLDILAANESSNDFTYLRGGKDGFRPVGVFEAGAKPVLLTSGDYNGDGASDVAVVAENSRTLAFSLGSNRGLWEPAEVIVSDVSQALASGDYDGDGIGDLVVGSTAGGVIVLRGGERGFSTRRREFVELGNGTADVISGRFDRDACTDLVVAESYVDGENKSRYRVVFLRGGAKGLTADRREELELERGLPGVLETGDFDGDGCLDLALGNWAVEERGVTLFLGHCDGLRERSFIPMPEYQPRGLLSGDYDRDGKDDLVVMGRTRESDNNRPGVVICLLGGPEGLTESDASRQINVGNYPRDLTSKDFDGDGFLDVVVASRNSGEVWFLRGGPDGLSDVGGRCVNLRIAGAPVALSSADYDGDGFPDVAVARETAGEVSYLKGGPGGLVESSVLSVGTVPTALTSGDFDSDGFCDVVVTNFESDNVTLLRGCVEGLKRARNIPAGAAPVAVTVGDFDGDAIPDLAVVNEGSVSVTFLRQRFLTPHVNVFLPGTNSKSAELSPLVDPRRPPRYELAGLSSRSFPSPTQVVLLPTPVFSLCRALEERPSPREPSRYAFRTDRMLSGRGGARPGRGLVVVTDAVKLLPEDVPMSEMAQLTLRLRDHDPELQQEVLEQPDRLRVFLQRAAAKEGFCLDLAPGDLRVRVFEGGKGITFPITCFGSYVVALERTFP